MRLIEKIKSYAMPMLVAIVAVLLFCGIIYITTKEDYVVNDDSHLIDGHVYKRVWSGGHTYLVDDLENCPKCKQFIINLADSIARNQ